MIRYRNRESGELISRHQVKLLHPNTSIPSVWGESVYEGLGIDPVPFPEKPNPSGTYKVVTEGEPTQDSSGDWAGTWSERDMTTDEKTAWDKEEAERIRASRDTLLAETDYLGLSDVTMSSAMITYRQALRDVPQQTGFPSTVSWPTKP